MRFIMLAAALALAPGPAMAQDKPVRSLEDIMDARLARLVDGVEPGVALGIVQGGEVLYAGQAGYANLEHEIPIGPETRFNIASNAKQYTALMALVLAQEGRLDLDADFRAYLPEAMPGIEEAISVRLLITHTSGIRDIYDLWGMSGTTWYLERLRSSDALALLDRQTGLNFAPGSRRSYSNSNYVLLASVIAEITGQDFHEYAAGFFNDRDMPSTSVRRRHGVIIPDLARAYGNWSGWLEDPALANLNGDGFLFTTLADQLRWEAQIQGETPTLPADLMEASQQPLPGAATQTYGYGLEFGTFGGFGTIYHVGSTGGYNAYLLRIPELDLAIVVMGNSTQIGVVGLGNEAARLLIGWNWRHVVGPSNEFDTMLDLAAPDDEAYVQGLVGLYRNEETGTEIRLRHMEGRAFTSERNGREREAQLGVRDEMRRGRSRMRFYRDEEGAVAGFRLDFGRNRNIDFRRVDPDWRTKKRGFMRRRVLQSWKVGPA
jgi:CubicO group peptidase (beta-lactamase class C family)